MNLHNLSEQEFDKKLREHLDKASVPYNPSSWNKLNRKLDSLFGANGRNNGSIIGLSLLLLLLTGAFFFGVSSFSKLDSSSEAESGASMEINHNTSSEASAHVSSADNENRISEVNRHTSSETNQDVSSKAEEQIPTAEHIPLEVNKKSSTDMEEPVLSERSANDLIKANEGASLLANQQFSSTGKQSSGINTPSGINDQVGASNQSPNNHKKLHTLEAVSSNGIAEIDSRDELPGEIQGVDSINTGPPPIADASTGSLWFVGFGYAPDISLVGFGEASSPGTNLNILVERRFGNRWSIQTGITYSSKKYKANVEDYHPPEGFWGYGEVPDQTDAECDVIDIPVNLRYYFKPGNRHQFYASTGLSTYFMLTEDYYYHYDDYGYGGGSQSLDSWSVRNENQHFFGVYNISAGYQRSIGKQWYLEIEPFIKLPLSGIGFGEVKLWSTGSMFSLKYKLK